MKKMFLIAVLILMAGCYLFEDNKKSYSGGDIVLKNQEIDLEKDQSSNVISRDIIADNEFEYKIMYIANISPIVIEGTKVQANDIKIYGEKAYIAYNTAGEEYKGAFQIVDISDEIQPVVEETFIFNDKDINSIYYNEDTKDILIGGGEERDTENSAFISRIPDNSISVDSLNNKVELLSKQLTSITYYNGRYYLSVGADGGGVYSLESSFTNASVVNQEFAKDDIRDLESYESGLLSLYTDGTDGTVRVGDAEIGVGEFSSTGHKSTLDYLKTGETGYILDFEDGFVFLGLAQEGFKIVKLGGDENADSLIFSADNPVDSSLNIASNSVSYDSGFIFWALGEYGFKVLRLKGLSIVDESTGQTGYNPDDFVESVGYHSLDKDYYTKDEGEKLSANHIVFKSNRVSENGEFVDKNYLFVASGLGGVNIYKLVNKDEYIIKDIDNNIRTEINKKILGKKLIDGTDEIISSPDIKLASDAQVTVSFLTEQAGYKNSIGIVIYGDNVQNENDLETLEIFENASKGGGGGALSFGDSKYAQDVTAGKNIGVYIDENGYNSTNPRRFYSIKSLNSDEVDHMAMYKTYNGDEEVYVYAIEDTNGGGDLDYNDVIIMITISPAASVENSDSIPESGV